MKKIILGILIISNLLLASKHNEFENLGIINKDVLKNVERFKFLEKKTDGFDKKRFEYLIKDIDDIDTQLINSISMYKGDEYMTKEEYTKVAKNVLKARKLIKQNNISEYILFFTSESVSNSTYMNILHSVGILQENGVNISTKQYLIGIPEDFESYMNDKKEYMENLTEKEKKYILKNFAIKLDPRLFDLFKIKKVPAIVYGICKGKNPVEKSCNFKYLIRGDTSLTNFFDKISQKEEKYKRYYEYLVGNKIIHDQRGK